MITLIEYVAKLFGLSRVDHQNRLKLPEVCELNDAERRILSSDVVQSLLTRCKTDNLPLVHIDGEEEKLCSSDPIQSAPRDMVYRWVLELCKTSGLTSTTGHLACAILDACWELVDPSTFDLVHFSVACVQVAAKYEEREVDIPRTKTLLRHFGERRVEAVWSFELEILQALDWKVGLVTSSHVLDMLDTYEFSVHRLDEYCGRPVSATLGRMVKENARQLADDALLILRDVDPVTVACACIIASRASFRVLPFCSPPLLAIIRSTGIDFSLLQKCAKQLVDDSEDVSVATIV